MAFKDERMEYKAIKLCESDNLDGPYTNITEPITEYLTEGPFLFVYEDKLYLMYDCYMKNEIKIKEVFGNEVKSIFPKDAGHCSYISIQGC